MNLDSTAVIPAHVMARDLGGETVILNLESGIYFGLDHSGARIWQLLSEGKTFAEVCDAMLAEYDVSREDIERDVLYLVNELRSQSLVDIATP